MLDLGTASEVVSVTGRRAAAQDRQRRSRASTCSGDRINALPLNFGGGGGNVGAIRNWLGFVILAPGVSGTNERASVNGAPGGGFKIYLEGQDVTSSNDTVWTSTVAAASVETIGEFSMQTANFSAEYGQVLGGVFNFTTKSGTNELHGSALRLRHQRGARRPSSVHAAPCRLSRKHNFGFSAGGPVDIPGLYAGRNKTFFFANLEMFRNRTDSPGARATVPTHAYRNGDFSAALTGRVLGTDPLGRPIMENAIYDPRTTRVVNGQVVRDPFPNNVIPSELFDPVALQIQSLIPRARQRRPPEQLRRRTSATTATRPSRRIKIDHNLGSSDPDLSATSRRSSPTRSPRPTACRCRSPRGATRRSTATPSASTSTGRCRPTLQLHAGVGYLRFHNPDSSPDDVLDFDAVKRAGLRRQRDLAGRASR